MNDDLLKPSATLLEQEAQKDCKPNRGDIGIIRTEGGIYWGNKSRSFTLLNKTADNRKRRQYESFGDGKKRAFIC